MNQEPDVHDQTRNLRLERAMHLLDQGRFDLAEPEARAAVANDPSEGAAYSVIALCLSVRDKHTEATQAAEQGVRLNPNSAWEHSVLAQVLRDRHMYDRALSSIQVAIKIDPSDSNYHSVESSVYLETKEYERALASAQRALELDPDSTTAGNLRAAALRGTGKGAMAKSQIGELLRASPNDPQSHTNMGWTLLSQGKSGAAGEHFREALRLSPASESARLGLIESLKARFPIYRLLLMYFMFMGRLSSQFQWAILIGAFLLRRVLSAVGKSSPEVAPFVNVFMVAYAVFALLTLVASPMLTLTLFLHPLGRYALTKNERFGALLFGLTLLPPLASLCLYAAGVYKDESLILAAVTGLYVVPASIACFAERKRGAVILRAVTIGIGVFGLFLIGGTLMNMPLTWPTMIALYALMCFGTVWLANYYQIRRPSVAE